MAHVQLTLLEGRTIEQKRRAVKRITESHAGGAERQPRKVDNRDRRSSAT